ncbi:MAG: response regulator [Alphaproteobacteria bacterium]|nr:response regulator [Alphaproteobacteria bacterium]
MRRALIVDDDPDVRDTIAAMLMAAGYDVVDPGSAAAALSFIASQPFDVVITDVLMPEVDGVAIVQAVRKVGPRCRVIAISGGSSGMPAAIGLRLTEAFGADAVLYKPFSRAELLAAVNGQAPAP